MAREKSWQRSMSSLCPLCKQHDETLSHVYQCTNEIVQCNRNQLISKMKKSLKSIKTSPLIINHIIQMMYQFCGGHRVTKIKPSIENDSSTSIMFHLSLAIDIQINTLGIQNMLLGIVTPLFSEAQRIYYQENSFGKNYNADRWGRWFVRLMMDFSQSIWKYRCELVVHSRQEGTMEHRLRDLAVLWLIQLKNTPTLLPIESRFLTNRNPRHFKLGALRSVNAWIRRVDIELKRKRESSHAGDIRKWIKSYTKPQYNSENKKCNNLSDSISQISTDDESTSSDLTNISNISNSVEAIRDLHLDDDTLPTFLCSKNTTPTSYMINVPPFPDEIVFEPDIVLQNVLTPPLDDKYANVRFHRLLPKILYDSDDMQSVSSICGTKVE